MIDAVYLRKLRRARNWNQHQLAEWLGSRQQFVSRMETGDAPVSQGMRARIALLQIREELAAVDGCPDWTAVQYFVKEGLE